jgi:uncharacterized OB-fold protein
MSGEILLPPIDATNEFFWQGARRQELRVQRCVDSGRLIFPPRARSPWGGHEKPDWVVLSGRGTVYSFIIPHPPLIPQFAEVAPYNVILVALEEDPTLRMVGNLIPEAGGSIAAIDPATIEIGARVRVIFEALNEEIHLPRWCLV